MNNLTHKFATETGFSSIRIQKLMDKSIFPEEKFENGKKEKIYKEAKYYHKAQKGLLRISKYQFNHTAKLNRKCLSKHNIKILSVEHGYDYGLANNDEELPDTKIWHINFASEKAFTEWGSESRSQEAAMIIEMPLLHNASIFLEQNIQPTLRYKSKNQIWLPSPLLFEGVPQWVSLYSGKIKNITWDKTNNVISMMAPYGGQGLYSEKQILNLFLTLFAAFGGAIKRGKKDKTKKTEIHTGNWGCGNMRNNKELIYLSQIYVASILGIDQIIFHCIDQKLLNNAIEKWKAIPNNLFLIEAIELFIKYEYTWRD